MAGSTTQYFLCGGTFFTLLLQSMKKPVTEKFGMKREFTEPQVLRDLIKIHYPDFKIDKSTDSFDKTASIYQACKISRSNVIPLNNATIRNAFTSRMKTDYLTCVKQMQKIIDDYFLEDSTGYIRIGLIKQLLELISIDHTVSDTALFYVLPNGKPVTKADMLQQNDFCLPAFLLGIWHYVTTNDIDNRKGEDTISAWHKKADKPNTKGEFISRIGESIEREIKLLPFDTDDKVETAEETGIAMVFADEQCSESEEFSEGVFTDAESETPKPDNQILNMGVIMNNVNGKNINAPGGTFYL
jgi:hypothetical protein